MIRFSLFGIPIGLHFSFALIAFIVGGQAGRGALTLYTEITVVLAVILIAVLLHEVGHALTARRFGASQISITLFAMGGVTTYSKDPPLSPGKRFLIAAAGSGIGIFVGGIVLLAWWAGFFDEASILLRFALRWFIFASLGWGILNWIPIRPLDGGLMLTAGLEMIIPDRADVIARVVTLLVGAVVVVGAVVAREPILALFVVFLIVVGVRPQPRTHEQRRSDTSSTDTAKVEFRRELSDEDGHHDFPI